MIALGIDPDTKNTGIALVQATGTATPPRVLWVGVAAVKASLPVEARILRMVDELRMHSFDDAAEALGASGVDLIVVEGQDAYAGKKRHPRPNDLIHLGQVAGAAVGTALWHFRGARASIPKPATWKGTCPKGVHNARILGRVGLLSDRHGAPIASPLSDIREDWHNHVIDAIGLALWGLEQAKAPMPRVRRYGS